MIKTMLGIGASLAAPKVLSAIKDQKVNVVHAIPGRVRLKCDRWKNEVTASNLTQVFTEVPIVKRVEASAVTGTLLIEFHEPTITQEQFDEIVQGAVNTSVASYPEVQSNLAQILSNLLKTLDSGLKKQTAGRVDTDSLLSVLLIVSGLLKLPANPVYSSSLLYWAYTIISKDKKERNGT
ncbi:HMA2 domain-containing protein [Metabacillus sp. 84]|uniref:HMA2 domain-containing protein n=1 Tax=Metabacillus sp. 84 TaxID=3404705 RepID=UPI003CF1ABE1